jgi:hypothetical protein
MKDRSEENVAVEGTPKALTFLQAAIPFAVTMVAGSVLTAVAGLFVYANVVDAKSRDFQFVVIATIGLGVSLVFAWMNARRALEQDVSATTGPAISLLKKYRRAVTQVGADAQAGQYSIGESYLRELLGRRGA